MKHLAIVGLCALLIPACIDPGPSSTTVSELRGTVTWIIDGDSLRVETGSEELEVRLVGINAPEEGECFYDRATRFLIDGFKGNEVSLSPVGTDQYGRVLAYVWDGDSLINRELVAGGFVIATTPEDGDPLGHQLLNAEENAYLQSRGLWAEDSCGEGPIPSVIIDFEASDPNPSGSPEDERIVVRNTSGTTVDLSGWGMRDESSRHRYRFSAGLTLQPGETFTVTSTDPEWEPGNGPVWNNNGDMVLLLDADGRVVARWRYPAPA